MVVKTRTEEEWEYLTRTSSQILDELNVKDLVIEDGESDFYQRAKDAAGDQAEAVLHVGHFWVSLEAGYMVAVDADLTPELADEGLARELAHRIQGLRRNANFEITDRIITYYQGPEDVGRVMRDHADYISQETLSERLVDGEPDRDAKSETQKVEGMEVTLGVRKV